MKIQTKHFPDILLLPVLLAAFVAMALAYSAIVPPYENQDEIEHAEVIRHIVTTGQLPVHGEAEAAGYLTRQESSQPPLYHILAAGWVRLWNLPLDAHKWQPVPGEVGACGDTNTLYSKAAWVNNPALAASEPQITTLYMTRLFSILLATTGLAGLYLLARRIFPRGLGPAFVVAIVAFNPQFLFISSGVNNDNVMTALAMWGMLVAFDLWDKGPTVKRVLLMSVLAGFGGLSKLSGLGLVGLGGLAVLLYGIRTRMPLGKLAMWGMLIVLPASLIVAPWLWRNYRLYGDLTALTPMLEKVGPRDYPIDWHEMRFTLLSYWAQIPCSFYPRAVYWPFFLLLGGGLAGAVLNWRRFDHRVRGLLVLSAVWFVVITVAWLRWDLITPAPGGRLLFPASGALALILAAGWQGDTTRLRNRLPSPLAGEGRGEGELLLRSTPPCVLSLGAAKVWTVALPILALVALVAGPMTLYGRPRVVDALPQHITQVDYEFGDAVGLRGYHVEVRQDFLRCIFIRESYCRPTLDFTLVWERTVPLDEDWTMVVQLVSPAPGATDLRFNFNRWPGHGNMATSTLPDGMVVDHYLVPLGEWPVTQAWSFQLGFTREGQRIPLTAGGEGTVAYLDMLRVPQVGPGETLSPDNGEGSARFGDMLMLTASPVQFTDDTASFNLTWCALDRPTLDYSVFIHAYAEDGTVLVTADNPPGHLAFPMSLYEAEDCHRYTAVISHGESGVAAIAVGLYDPATGARVPVTGASVHTENDAVYIWERGE